MRFGVGNLLTFGGSHFVSSAASKLAGGCSPRRKLSSSGASRSRSWFSGGRPSRQLARSAVLTEAPSQCASQFLAGLNEE
jgi:hypothetical protein